MDDLAQKFEALASNIGLLDRQAGDLPPGRARFATSPVSTGPPTAANTIGIIDVACSGYRPGRVREDDIDLEPHGRRFR
jgi:hypothetical protein